MTIKEFFKESIEFVKIMDSEFVNLWWKKTAILLLVFLSFLGGATVMGIMMNFGYCVPK
jgi:hypothetical protein